jgi:hypothetical protein
MGTQLDLWDVSEDHPVARKQLLQMRKIVNAAIAVVTNPAWAGICDEDVMLEQALLEAGEIPCVEVRSTSTELGEID